MSSSATENDVQQVLSNNTPSETENIDKTMAADDSQLVDEILTELNNDVAPQTSNTVNQPSGMPNNDMMMHSMHSMHSMEPDQEIPPTMDVEFDTIEQETNGFMKKMKRPLIVLCLSFIVFNPVVISMLEKNLPRIFSSSGSILVQQGRILLLSTLLAVLYFATNCIV